ncbi:Spo0B domain-containing protein [Sporosarcina sp. E16_8]|uniref:Spo0B domain-containing protein n=1 Tax=Sporosarcina sp. E16_8 TaxID=2789295 RepID=UPI001A9202AF|nr:Spo0B domain-containing protein [Sporosarcina sp. E16_8]MBO0587071.1 Spo0B domain-containing protein [Sporosarcina sp. E16_8]
MGNNKLTTAEALKFARHDFLNELQLVLLYIDLDKLPEAKQKILEATDRMREVALLERLGLPAVETWLTTFDWLYGAFTKTMTCTIASGIRKSDDTEVVTYLERLFSEAEKTLDPTSEYETQIDVQASAESWSITITVHGQMGNRLPAPIADGNFTIEEIISQNQWTFTISGQ